MIDDACAKREKLLEDYRAKLEHLLHDDGSKKLFKGAATWLAVLTELERVVKLGSSVGWSYGKDNAKYR